MLSRSLTFDSPDVLGFQLPVYIKPINATVIMTWSERENGKCHASSEARAADAAAAATAMAAVDNTNAATVAIIRAQGRGSMADTMMPRLKWLRAKDACRTGSNRVRIPTAIAANSKNRITPKAHFVHHS